MNFNPDNYTSFALSWELKKLGFPQVSNCCFNSLDKLVTRPVEQRTALCAAAFTVSELFDALPAPGPTGSPFLYAGISRAYKSLHNPAFKYFCAVSKSKISGQADTMPDAVAMAIVQLLKKGKLSFQTEALEGSLKSTLQADGLIRERVEIVRHLRTLPVQSDEFKATGLRIQELDNQIKQAKAKDDLTFLQAAANLGLSF